MLAQGCFLKIFYHLFLTGISTWGKRVGRKIDQIKLGESNERLQYVVTPPPVDSGLGGQLSESELDMMAREGGHGIRRHSSSSNGETIEFLVVNDDLILQRKPHAVSQPDLVFDSQKTNNSRTAGSSSGAGSTGPVKRRVSRVESLRNLFFNRGTQNGFDHKRKMMQKRTRSAEKDRNNETEKV